MNPTHSEFSAVKWHLIKKTKKSDNQQMMQDKELLTAIAEGDQQAFNTLYQRYYQKMVNFAYQYVKQKDTAMEVANDVMMAVWNQANTFEQRSSVSTWMYAIAFRQAQKAFKKNVRHDHEEFDETWQQSDSDENNAFSSADQDEASKGADLLSTELEQAMQSQQLWDHMEKAIDQLSEEQKSVVYLTSIGYSYPEIAEMINCPANTVKTRMFHARRSIKKLFKSIL